MKLINPLPKRALACCGAFFALGIGVAWWLPALAAWIAAGIALVGGASAIGFVGKRRRYLCVMAIAMGIGAIFTIVRMAAMPEAGTTLQGPLSGRVCALPRVGTKSTLIMLQDVRVGEERLRHRVRLYVPPEVGQTVRYGDELWAGQAALRAPSPKRNDGTPDTRLNAWARGAAFDASVDALTIAKRHASPLGLVFALRARMIGALRALLPADVFGTVQGMLFGDTAELDDAWLDAYRATGVSHVLAVSGLHVGIVASAVHVALRPIKKRWLALGLTVAILLLYAAMNGFSASVTRATLMSVIALFGAAIGERNDTLNALGFAMLVALLINPFQLLTASFLLSFTAVIGIVFFMPLFQNGLRRIPLLRHRFGKAIRNSLATSASAQIGILPAQLSLFGTLPVWSVFINVLAVPIAGAVVMLAFATALLGAIALPLGIPTAYLTAGLVRVQNAIILFSSRIPYAVVTPGALGIGGGIASIFACLALWRFTKGARLRCAFAALAVLAAIGSYACDRYMASQRLEIVFLDVGQGDAAYLRQGRTRILIDGGNRQDFAELGYSVDYGTSVLLPFLRNRGVSHLDAVIASHADSDHYGGLSAVLASLDVDRLIVGPDDGANELGYRELLALAEKRGVERIVLRAGDRLMIGDASAKVVWPDAWQNDTNESSLVMQMEYAGKRVLFTGDLGVQSEGALLARLEDVGLLKVGHHGSKYASSAPFLEALQPEIALISVGTNPHGHPSEEAIARLKAVGAAIYATQDDGAITAMISKRGIAVSGKLGLKQCDVKEGSQGE